MSRQAYSYRDDPSVPAFPDERPVIIFDGVCVFCSAFARFVMRADKRRRFRLLAAQSPLGDALYRHYALDPVNYRTSILLADGIAWFESDAILRIYHRLGLPWSVLAIGWAMPRRVRDHLYGVIARNRLRWFGVRETCFAPDPAQADRFLK